MGQAALVAVGGGKNGGVSKRDPVTFAEMEQMAQAVAKSGLFPAIKTPEAALGLMLLCQAEGLHPITALRRYHIIQGQPAMKADTMLAEFQHRGGTVRWIRVDHEVCEAVFLAPGVDGATAVKWTLDDAKRAKLLHKDNWQQYPRQQLRARTISEGVRLTMPEVIAGLYTPEEVQDMIEAQVEPPAATITDDLMPRRKGEAPESNENGGESAPIPAPVVPAPSAPSAAAPTPVADQGPTASSAVVVRFTIGKNTFVTRGITYDQMMTSFDLVKQTEKAQKGLARAVLVKEFGVEHRKDLTEEQAGQYLTRLTEILHPDGS